MNKSNLIGSYLIARNGYINGEIYIVRDSFPNKDFINLILYNVINQSMCDIHIDDIYKYQQLFTENLEDGITLIHDYDRIISTLNGFLHCESGPAVRYFKNPEKNIYAIKGIKYTTKEEYFELLNDEQKEKVIWNLNKF